MKQLIQSYKTGEMKLEEVPVPQVLPGMVLVRTKTSVISAGTEKMLVELARRSILGKARSRPDLVRKVISTAKKEGLVNTLRKVQSKLENPIPLGYSIAGIVESVGEGIDNFRVGDFVACGGAGYANHAEYNVIPKNLCVRIPGELFEAKKDAAFEESAFTTIGAIALQGVRQANLTLGERVCVIGLGLIGQLTVQLCKANGCKVLGADIDEERIKLAIQLGADNAVHTNNLEEAVKAFTHGMGIDAVIITASARDSQLVSMAGEISRQKGRVVIVGFVGMDIPRDIYYKKELDIRLSMSYGPGRYDVEYEERGHDYPVAYVRWTEQRNMQAFLELLAAQKISVFPLISHRFHFEEILKAYDLILKGSESYMGVVLEYANTPPVRRTIFLNKDRTVASDEIVLGVIGAGNFAKSILLPRFTRRQKVTLQSITSARGISAKAAAEQFGFRECTGSAEEIIKNYFINTVIIATRHNTHGKLVQQAISAGKHVFVEKPLCITKSELEKIIQAYNTFDGKPDKRPILFVGFNRRFSPFVRGIKTVLQERSTPMMATYQINAGFIPKDSWIQHPAEGGGRIIGEVCHFVDTLRFLVGSAVQTVQAACIRGDMTTHVNRDSLSIILTYEDGSVCSIIYHTLGNPEYPKERLEIAADGKLIILTDYCSLEIYSNKRKRIKGKQQKGFDEEIDAFIKAIIGGDSSPIPFGEIVETTEVTFAIHECLNNAEIVRLNLER